VRAVVVGAGSWGTVLANVLTKNGHDVRIWAREPEVVASINEQRVNRLFLPDCALSEGLVATGAMDVAVSGAELMVSAAPSHAVRAVSTQVAEAQPEGAGAPVVVSVSKGLEPGTDKLMTEVLQEVLPASSVVALSGPSFAKEVHQGQPTAVVSAGHDIVATETTQRAFSCDTFRVYSSTDVVGVQLGGALKNVVAIAAGIASGLGLGYNPIAALLTRGLAEITRLGEAMGASPRTFAGLAGMGDLILTCTGTLSRNRTLGVALGQGKTLEEAMKGKLTVAEGVKTARLAVDLGRRHGVELPIAMEVERILFEGKAPKQAMRDLMERELKSELWQ